ncbi:MAG: hypothetical protein WD601_12255 [Pseudohongiellaceae bacterium]
MYIHRSVLLLFIFIYLVFLIGMDWITAADAPWYRPFIIALSIIVVSACLQGPRKTDDY